ncbi:MAG TPA: four-carbon acid sugar kinase family protein [Gaiella sp.]|nr:four-carbon acid sugar kinase family protein [Gaiella sp.]
MSGRLVVLDDDPTGAQALAGIEVLLDWSAATIADALRTAPAVHLLTNTRALEPDAAREAVRTAATVAHDAAPAGRIVLRGDSTLRAHLREEYEGLRDALWPGRTPPLLLVPALPAAGRVTRDGAHLVVRNGTATPVGETEYARDGIFSYGSSNVLEWAEERSAGLFPAATGVSFPLDTLRRPDGPGALSARLTELVRDGLPCVCVPDVESDADVALVAEAVRNAPAELAVRCAPALAGALAGSTARAPAPMPRVDCVLVVCGSYVPGTTRQLAKLRDAVGAEPFVDVDVLALVADDPSAEIERVAGLAGARLESSGVAIVATPRQRPEGTRTIVAAGRIADGLATAAAAVEPRPDLVVAKGGVTSAVTARAFGADRALVVGPILPGVSLWTLSSGVDYVVVPGNVGDDDLLARLVGSLREPALR